MSKLKNCFTNVYMFIFGFIMLFWMHSTLSFTRSFQDIHITFIGSIILLALLVAFIHYHYKGKYDTIMLWVFAFLILIWQIYSVLTASQAIQDDSGIMFRTLTHPEERMEYFKIYPNNMFALCFEKLLFTIIPLPVCQIAINFFNTIIVDLAFGFMVATAFQYNKEHLKSYVFIALINLSLFGYFLKPYTDTFSLLSLAIFLFLFILNKNKPSIKLKVGLGVSFAFMVLFKPSLWVVAVALFLYYLLVYKQLYKKFFITAGVCALGFGCTYLPAKIIMANQTIVQVDETKISASPLHFVNIGLEGFGGYSSIDDKKLYSFTQKEEQTKYLTKEIKNTVKEKGLGGLIKHWQNKMYRTTMDGTFGFYQTHSRGGAILEEYIGEDEVKEVLKTNEVILLRGYSAE